MSHPLIAILIVIGAGSAVATQSPINAALARHLGSGIAAAVVSFGVGFVVLLALAAVLGQAQSLARVPSAAPILLIGGAIGAYFVWAALWAVPILGALTTVSALVLGQMLAALVIDSTGMLGLAVQGITPTRLLAAGLVAGGVMLSRL
ncbi:MAG: DMT family transporter [Pseudomonadota bacterium]